MIQKVSHQYADAIVSKILVTLKKKLCFSIFVYVILHHNLWTTFRISFCLKLLGIRLVIRMTTVTYLHVFPLNWNTHTIKTLFLEREQQLKSMKSILRFTIAFLGLIRITDFLGREAKWLIHNSLHQAILLCLWNYTRDVGWLCTKTSSLICSWYKHLDLMQAMHY